MSELYPNCLISDLHCLRRTRTSSVCRSRSLNLFTCSDWSVFERDSALINFFKKNQMCADYVSKPIHTEDISKGLSIKIKRSSNCSHFSQIFSKASSVVKGMLTPSLLSVFPLFLMMLSPNVDSTIGTFV